MPFKSGKSPQDAAQNVNNALTRIASEKVEVALTTVAYAIKGNADFYVPVDTNALMNSGTISVMPHSSGFRATIGYYQKYAAALHGSSKYTPLWKPQPAGTPGKKTGGYNAAATAQWIPRGVADTDVVGIFAEQMKV